MFYKRCCMLKNSYIDDPPQVTTTDTYNAIKMGQMALICWYMSRLPQ